jgi:hypothetical protein
MNSETKFDIFLSYQWDNKTEVKELYTKLNNELVYRVWIDDNELYATASLYDQIAQGIDNSLCLVACVTEKYIQSENCKLEIEYAQTKKIPIICIMLERMPLDQTGSVCLLVNGKMRLNFYKQNDKTNLWSGDIFEKLKESIDKSIRPINKVVNTVNIVNNTVNININQNKPLNFEFLKSKKKYILF